MLEPDRIWRQKTDEELVDAANRLFEFTAAGERCIREELKRRGLAEPPPSPGQCPGCGRAIAWNHPETDCTDCRTPLPPDLLARLEPPGQDVWEMAEQRPVFVANGDVEARQVQTFLESAGIPTATRRESFGRVYGLTLDGLGAVSIVVSSGDEARARALLAAADSGSLRLPDEPDPERS